MKRIFFLFMLSLFFFQTSLALTNSTDSDADGIVDFSDNCPFVSNAEQQDADGDGVGELCEERYAVGVSCNISITTGRTCYGTDELVSYTVSNLSADTLYCKAYLYPTDYWYVANICGRGSILIFDSNKSFVADLEKEQNYRLMFKLSFNATDSDNSLFCDVAYSNAFTYSDNCPSANETVINQTESTNCSSSQLSYCSSESNCTGAGGKWCNNYCYASNYICTSTNQTNQNSTVNVSVGSTNTGPDSGVLTSINEGSANLTIEDNGTASGLIDGDAELEASMTGEVMVESETKARNASESEEVPVSDESEPAAVEAGEVVEQAQTVTVSESSIESAPQTCNGCVANESCVPYGLRASDEYCALNNSMLKQKTKGVECSNNFECSSNLCLGSCVDSNIITLFLSWLSRLFGLV